MEAINFIGKRARIISFAHGLFDHITRLSKKIRPDEKERTGIQILVREIGTRNLIFASIYEPSEAAQFFAAEKAVRSGVLGHCASENTEDEDKMQFAGSVTVVLEDGTKIQISTSGLKAEEDVTVDICLLSYILQWPAKKVMKNVIENNGKLPQCLSNKSHHLYKIVEPYFHKATL